MEELMGIRGVLEAYALEQAFDHFTEADLLQLELFVNQSRYYLRENNIDAIFENNTKFHDFILEKSMNKRLQTILSNLMDSILSFRIVTLHYPGNPERSIERHSQIIQAIKNKDKELAKRLIMEDVNVGKEILDELYKDDSAEQSV